MLLAPQSGKFASLSSRSRYFVHLQKLRLYTTLVVDDCNDVCEGSQVCAALRNEFVIRFPSHTTAGGRIDYSLWVG